MNYGAVNLLATVICLTSIGWCQSSPSSQNTLPPGHASQQNDQRTVTVPPPNGASQFSADSSTCSPANNDKLPKSSKNTDPHAKPPSSLPATTVPGTTTPCVDSTVIEKTPAGAKQTAPSSGTAPTKPEPKKQDNAPVPLASPNQTSVAAIFFGSGRLVSASSTSDDKGWLWLCEEPNLKSFPPPPPRRWPAAARFLNAETSPNRRERFI